MTARALGTATISFGLVSIPIKLYTSNESSGEVSFNWLHDECGQRVRQQYICSLHGTVVTREHMVKGYEFAKEQYVKFSAEELKALDAVATQTIALEEFVPAAAVDPLYVDKSYYVGPDKGGEKAYCLLAEAMRTSGLVGIASYSARGKQYIVQVRPFKEGLVIHQLRYAEEVKPWSEVPLPELPAVKQAELGLAMQIIQQIAAETFTPERYKDEVRTRMLALIDQKVAGAEITAPPVAPVGKVIDLMEALKASLGMADKAAAKPAVAAADDVTDDVAPAAPVKKARRAKG
jgi:DNA end-binding protein Ku